MNFNIHIADDLHKKDKNPVYIHQFQLFRLMQKGTVSTLLILRLAKMEKV